MLIVLCVGYFCFVLFLNEKYQNALNTTIAACLCLVWPRGLSFSKPKHNIRRLKLSTKHSYFDLVYLKLKTFISLTHKKKPISDVNISKEKHLRQ